MPDLSLIVLTLTGNRGLKQIVSCARALSARILMPMQPLVPTETGNLCGSKPRARLFKLTKCTCAHRSKSNVLSSYPHACSDSQQIAEAMCWADERR